MLTTVHHREPILALKSMKNPVNFEKKKVEKKRKKKLKKAGKSIPSPRAGMDFPALYRFNLTNFSFFFFSKNFFFKFFFFQFFFSQDFHHFDN